MGPVRERPVRPWLTVIEDDHSRAIAGYSLNLSAPIVAPEAPGFGVPLLRASYRHIGAG